MPHDSSDPFRLDNKVVLITGAGGGLGSAIAHAVAKAGANIAALEQDRDALSSLAASFASVESRLLDIAGDATDPSSIASAFQRTEDTLGPVDVLVNTAFVAKLDAPEVLSLADWKLNLDLNLTGYFLCAQEAGKR